MTIAATSPTVIGRGHGGIRFEVVPPFQAQVSSRGFGEPKPEAGVPRSSTAAIGRFNGMPSMTALLGMLALAGFQNRDKLSELLKSATSSGTQSGPGGQASPPLNNELRRHVTHKIIGCVMYGRHEGTGTSRHRWKR